MESDHFIILSDLKACLSLLSVIKINILFTRVLTLHLRGIMKVAFTNGWLLIKLERSCKNDLFLQYNFILARTGWHCLILSK